MEVEITRIHPDPPLGRSLPADYQEVAADEAAARPVPSTDGLGVVPALVGSVALHGLLIAVLIQPGRSSRG